ncbi:xylan O-acetyltransferase 5-like isoform X2 [Phragmites australis]|uniref:xylan O-acetyltransferase 5-like isoform X2 n=1 Tax=Phragmites australis TaxID=29695 RepID=UPI002D79AD46|nr:xylan O-acetyltransferase 5-like isoform X2 [Phragmites australis]
MRIPRRKGGAGPLAVGAPSLRVQVAAVFALAVLLGVSVLYDSAHIAASLRRHGGGGPRAYAKPSGGASTTTREEASARAPPAQGAESAAAEGTDRADPPPHQQQRQEEEEEAMAKPGAAAGSSQQEAALLEGVVEGGGRGGEDPGTCDLYRGRWVYDEARAPLYKESGCEFLTEQVTCMRNGRRDDDYQKWRWQPDGCDLPRFEAKLLLEKLRNKRLMFVGDSLNRNQWESMVCLVQSEAPWDKKSLVKNGSLNVFRLQEYNATVEFYWAPFLVESNSDDPDIHSISDRMIKPTSIAKHAANWEGVDYLIFNTYIWWMNTPNMKTLRGGSFSRKPVKYGEMERVVAYRKVLKTWSRWVEEHIDPKRTTVLFMSVSPVHMQSEGWGSPNAIKCFSETQPAINYTKTLELGTDWDLFAVSQRVTKSMKKVPVHFINITALSEIRKDAHTSVHTLRQGKLLTKEQKANPRKFADCIHWCLPGVPDTWNEFVYGHIVSSAPRQMIEDQSHR